MYHSSCPQWEDVFCPTCMSQKGGSETCHVLSEVTGCGPARTGGVEVCGALVYSTVACLKALWVIRHSVFDSGMMMMGIYRIWFLTCANTCFIKWKFLNVTTDLIVQLISFVKKLRNVGILDHTLDATVCSAHSCISGISSSLSTHSWIHTLGFKAKSNGELMTRGN